MRRNNKQVTTYFILFGLLLIGVVYAILQANLQINGTAKIQSNTWDIHFDNIQVNTDSVPIGTGDSAATIDSENNCKVDFEVTLSIPGDFYEFTIDVVNAGTIDGMIGELTQTLKVNNEVVEDTPDYLDYIVTYSDGVEIEENHKITAGTTETYLVRLEYKTDIEELPEATTISTSLETQYIQADTNSINRARQLYDVFKKETLNENELVQEYTGEHKDSFTTNGTQKIYYWYAESDDTNSANTILDKWNVVFGGFCWQMWRTTDTGGVKLIYNGVPSNGKCTSTGANQRIGYTYSFNLKYTSPAYAGYMYNPNTLIDLIQANDASGGSLFGKGVTYSAGTYTLTSTSNMYDTTHHYTCSNTTGNCSTVRYYYYNSYYIELSDGRNIEETLEDMLWGDEVNQTNSAIKTKIDTWYQNNMTSYTSKLEDIIFCNDRSITSLGGWNPNGGPRSTNLNFKSNSLNSDLSCTNITDQFSMNNSKAQLIYPIGLMTSSEASLLNNSTLRITGNVYWLASPSNFGSNKIYGRVVNAYGSISTSDIHDSYDVRPAISLKPGTLYVSGDGSKNNPYIVE